MSAGKDAPNSLDPPPLLAAAEVEEEEDAVVAAGALDGLPFFVLRFAISMEAESEGIAAETGAGFRAGAGLAAGAASLAGMSQNKPSSPPLLDTAAVPGAAEVAAIGDLCKPTAAA
jgi:hypothetical protein